MTTPQTLRCKATGRKWTAVTKSEPKNGYLGGVKVVHLKREYMEMSIRDDLVLEYFEVIGI